VPARLGAPAADDVSEPPATTSPVRRDPPESADELREVLERFKGNINATARWYGCHRRQVYRWLESFGIERGR
jgi:ActR/RegA family two-component response regulator